MSTTKGGDVTIPIQGGNLRATRVAQEPGMGMVIFAHGSGSSRLSPRNLFVAEVLNKAGLGTLLLDLLTIEEDRTYENRFDIPLLADRLATALRWEQSEFGADRPFAFFGASTGAGAALIAAARVGDPVKAVVSRGGRPDLAGNALATVVCPTLLIVGGFDDQVIALNREALARIPVSTTKELVIVPGATHLFEEPGTLEQVADLARDWLVRYAAS